jgi:PAS domain S-box-containing protein
LGVDSRVAGGTGTPAAVTRSDGGSPGTRSGRDRGRLSRRIVLGTLIVALAIVALTGATLWRLREDQLDDGLSDLATIDLLVASQTEHAFESVGIVLDGIAEDLRAQHLASADALRQASGDEGTYRLLRAKMAGAPQLDGLTIVAADGEIVNDTRGYPLASQTNLADRDYFLRLRDHPELAHDVTAPLQGGDGTWTIYIGRRLSAPNGAFAGIVLGTLSLRYFEGIYTDYLQAVEGDGKSIALWRNDGQLLVRTPAASSGTESTAENAPALLDNGGATTNRNGGAFWHYGATGRVAVAQRQLDQFPLTVETREPAAEILKPWRDEWIATLIAGGVLLSLLSVAIWLLLRQLRAAALVSEERARANREAEAREDIERAMAKAETAMREAQHSEARFRDIVEVGSDWIWETDAQHRFTMIAGAKQPKVDLIGKTRWEQEGADSENDELWRQHKADLDAHHPFRQFRFAIDLPNQRFHVCVNGKPVFDDDGTFVGYRGTVTDETELVEARERAVRADALLRNAIESIAEGFVIFDADDRFVMCNEAYRKMYGENAAGFVPGVTYEQIMRQALATGRHPDSVGREEEWLAERLRKHRTALEFEESRLADGRWVMRSERRMPDGGIAGLRIDITALKAAQESLRESQVMLSRAQQLSGTGSVVRNLKTKAIEWSDEMYRIFGLDRTTFTPQTEAFLALVHPEDRERVAAALASGNRGMSEPAMQFRILRPDGTIRWVHREADFWRDPDGKPAVRLTTYKDTTEQRANEARQRELEVLLRDAIESISEGFVIYDADDRLVLCNEAYRRLYPYSADLMVPGARFVDILRVSARINPNVNALGREEDWLAERVQMHQNPGTPFESQLEDGRWLLISERRTSSGGTAGLRVDISALKRVQESLRESRQRLDRTQQIAHIGTVERNLRTNEVIWSDETYRIFGVSPENHAPSAENLMVVVHPEDRTLLMNVLRRAPAEHGNTGLKFRITRPNGEIRVISSRADTAYDEAGRPHYVSVAMMDITEKELANDRQIELETQLRHSEKLTALGTLAGGIAHDLNNTLVPILALSKLAMEELSADTPLHTDLDTIHQASLQARDLVRQILTFSRKETVVEEPTDVAAKIREVLQILHASVPSTIELVERIAAVPPILADASQLQQIVINLVTNAAHAIGDQVGRVTVSLDEVPGERGECGLLRLAIADTGCGMSPEIMHRMFEPFFTTRGVGEGTGLGLSVVHGIVASRGGTIDAKSTVGKGTEFIILLPAKPANAAFDVAAVA